MADALKGVIIIILLAFVFGVYPAFRQSEVVERNTKLAANAAVVEFVDTVRAKGYLDTSDYELFLHSLDASYGVFKVQMEYYKRIYSPYIRILMIILHSRTALVSDMTDISARIFWKSYIRIQELYWLQMIQVEGLPCM